MLALDGGTIALALIAAVVAPSILAAINMINKRQDWARQDAVAAAAKRAADEIVAANKQSTEAVHELGEMTASKLEEGIALQTVTHALVNSDLTASLESELAALKEIRTLRADGPRTDDNARALQQADERIAKLQARIADRLKQQHFAEDQLSARKASAQAPVPIAIDRATVTIGVDESGQPATLSIEPE